MHDMAGQDDAGSGPPHVAIIGCGFTGTSALQQLVDRRPVRRITVFEATGDFGPGFADRRDDSPAYLLNNTTDSLCLLPHHRQAFIAWLQGPVEPPEPKDHLPRGRYGDFLSDVVAAATTMAAAKGIVVQRLPVEVSGLDEPSPADGGGVRLHWAGGSLQADAAILATGRCPPRLDIALPPAGSFSSGARLVPSQVRDSTLDALPLDAWHIPCAFGREQARVLVDCRGALDRRVDSPAQPPLVRAMAARGLLQPHRLDGAPADGAAIDMATLRAEGSRHVHVAGMWLWGPGLFTSSAFMMARAVQTILAALYPGVVERPASG